jgi:hypothetical protein
MNLPNLSQRLSQLRLKVIGALRTTQSYLCGGVFAADQTQSLSLQLIEAEFDYLTT